VICNADTASVACSIEPAFCGAAIALVVLPGTSHLATGQRASCARSRRSDAVGRERGICRSTAIARVRS
jgi:hypothetical protein